MPANLIENAPQVRCYECGSDKIFSVCHHCAKPMCEDHSPPAFREVAKPGGSNDEGVKAISRELAGLKLGRAREGVYHCEDHAHMVRGPLMGIIGIGIAVLGIIVLLFSPVPGLVLLLVGAGMAGFTFIWPRLRAPDAGATLPLPVIPDVNAVDIIERLVGTIRLEDGEYTSEVKSVTGEVAVNISVNDGRKKLELYRKRHRAAAQNNSAGFTAGFAMLEGQLGLEFLPGQQAVLVDRAGMSLSGESTEGHDLFPAEPGRTQGEWTVRAPYKLQRDRVPSVMPLWIVPSLVPASDMRALEIDLHWNPIGSKHQGLDLQLFDLIELQVPSRWGSVESFQPDRVETSTSGGRRIIKWQQLPPRDDDSKTLAHGTNSRMLKISFEKPITEEPKPKHDGVEDAAAEDGDDGSGRLTLSGTLEVTFAGTLSGLTGVGLYLPGGGRGHEPEVNPQTKITVEFDISLSTLRYQDKRVIPDENNDEDRELGRNKVDQFDGITPDPRRVAELTNAISADGYYVKSVVEHPPYRDDGRPNVVNRVWDIAGRRYDGVFPIDFDINLRGNEISLEGSSALSGKTFAQVTVKGAHAKTVTASTGTGENFHDAQETSTKQEDEDDDELLKQIENTWTNLHQKVKDILEKHPAVGTGVRAIAAPADDVVEGEAIDEDGDDRVDTDDRVDNEAEAVDVVEVVDIEPDFEVIDLGGGVKEPSGYDVVAYRVADLRKQRQDADNAVVAGKISEDTYRGIIARIEAEFSELRELS
jgi:hypothetical protein